MVIDLGNAAARDYAAFAGNGGADDALITSDVPTKVQATAPPRDVILFLGPKMTEDARRTLDRLIAMHAGQSTRFVGIVTSFRAHLGDRSAIEIETDAIACLRPLASRMAVFRPGYILSPSSIASTCLRRLAPIYPLVPARLRSCCVEGDELFAAIEAERRAPAGSALRTDSAAGEPTVRNAGPTELPTDSITRRPSPYPGIPGEGRGEGSSAGMQDKDPHPGPLTEYRERENNRANPARTSRLRTFTLLGPNRPWREVLAERRTRSLLPRIITVFSLMLSLLGIGHLAAFALGVLSRRHAGIRALDFTTLKPKSFRELRALYNPYNYRHVKIVGYNNGVQHFGQLHPGRTIVSTVNLDRVVAAGADAIRGDSGVTVRKALDFLGARGQDLYVIPNYSYVCLGTAFFVPIHGSAADFSCVVDTVTKVVLYDPVADRLIVAARDDGAFRNHVYDTDASVLLLRMYLRVKPKSRFYMRKQERTSPTAAELLTELRDASATNVEVRKGRATEDVVRVLKFYNHIGESAESNSRGATPPRSETASDDSTAGTLPGGYCELPRDRLGQLWDRIEENPLTCWLMHLAGRRLLWHVELFFTEEEFTRFWETHRTLPLRKMQFRHIRRDGFPRSPFRDHDCISVDTFAFRLHRATLEKYLRQTFTTVRLNPGKHSR